MGSKSYCHFVILSFSEKYVQILLTYHYLYLCNVIPREPTVAGRIENRRPKGTNGLCRKAGKEKSKATGRRRKVGNQRSLSREPKVTVSGTKGHCRMAGKVIGKSNGRKEERELSSMQAIVQLPNHPERSSPPRSLPQTSKLL